MTATNATKTVSEYADEAMAQIDDDIAEGHVPAWVTEFSTLHDYVDANCYLLHVPFGSDIANEADPDGVALVNAVSDEVQRRLQARHEGETVQPQQRCIGRLRESIVLPASQTVQCHRTSEPGSTHCARCK